MLKGIKMLSRYFCEYTIGENAYENFNDVCKNLGKRVLIVGGETALSVCLEKLKKSISDYFEIVDIVIYGKECTLNRANELFEEYKASNIDFVIGCGGGKAIDTSKILSDLMGVCVVTVPTIASTCACSSALSVVYNENHAFERFWYYKRPAYHCFIDTNIIANAPDMYIRAGMGDTLAKHYEVEFSARGRELDYSTRLGLEISNMCNKPIFEYGEKALKSAKENKITPELEEIALAILISTGMVSMLINPDYNGAMAHALFYGLTTIEGFEEKFLHGDVVGYCTMVQLVVDEKADEAKKVKDILKKLGIETTLRQRNIPCTFEYLSNSIKSALNDPDMKVIPYEVTDKMLFSGIEYVENM